MPSRGALVSDFLAGERGPAEYVKRDRETARELQRLQPARRGRGFALVHLQPREARRSRVAPGVHGLSNHLLDTPWPKVEKAKAQVRRAAGQSPSTADAAFDLLGDTERAASAELPSTGREPGARGAVVGDPHPRGRRLRNALLHGGCASRNDGRVEFHERSYREDGARAARSAIG